MPAGRRKSLNCCPGSRTHRDRISGFSRWYSLPGQWFYPSRRRLRSLAKELVTADGDVNRWVHQRRGKVELIGHVTPLHAYHGIAVVESNPVSRPRTSEDVGQFHILSSSCFCWEMLPLILSRGTQPSNRARFSWANSVACEIKKSIPRISCG